MSAARSSRRTTGLSHHAACLHQRSGQDAGEPGLSAQGPDRLDRRTGARGTTPILGTWDISAYRAWVKNESITVIVDFVNNLTAEGNASPTLHTGVEVGLQTPLWRAANPDTNISLRQSYTYSDFRFRHDAQWGRNQLASLPRHFYQGELAFNHASGAYLSGKVQASSSVPIDYANTFYARPYAIFGATIGYAPRTVRTACSSMGTTCSTRAMPRRSARCSTPPARTSAWPFRAMASPSWPASR
jgi:hypothetical protein